MNKLPDFDVIVWLYANEFGKQLEKEILSVINIKPYESFEYEGVLDMHWGFYDWEEAVSFSKSLDKFINNPNLIFLKASNTKTALDKFSLFKNTLNNVWFSYSDCDEYR